MFLGSYNYSVDSKGRISIPAKLRKNISPEANDTFIMTRAVDKCIVLYPLDQWKNNIEPKLLQLSEFKPDDRYFLRELLENASDDSLDSQSRLLIPQKLLKFAGIEKEVFILGALNKIELWNPEIYDNYMKSQEKSYAEVAESVMSR